MKPTCLTKTQTQMNIINSQSCAIPPPKRGPLKLNQIQNEMKHYILGRPQPGIVQLFLTYFQI